MIKIFKAFRIVPLIAGIVLFASCTRDIEELEEEYIIEEEETLNDIGNVNDHDDEGDYFWEDSEIIYISLDGNSITAEGAGTTNSGSTLTIISAGTYSISGSLDDGQIIVNTTDNSIVRLILDDVSISCSYSAPIYIESAKKTMIVLADSTNNSLSDGSTYSSGDDGPNAAIYSADDLTIYGDGTLEISANYNDGICSKDGLVISGGNISIDAVDDGIRGKDYLVIKAGDISINAGGDGLKSDNDEDTSKGYISIENGNLNIASEGDGIAAETDVLVSYGDVTINTESSSSLVSSKGIKAGILISVEDGLVDVESADDGFHSDTDIEISGGRISIASGDDGIRSEYDTDISGGNINISECYEGLESAQGSINISAGEIYIVASDDGINVSAGGASSGGGPGHKSTAATESDYSLNISGGYLWIDCEGDGLDSNEDMTISGGTMIVNSASANENSSIDCDGTCNVDGGTLIGIGVSRMSQAPDSSSDQYSMMIDFSSTIASGKIIHIEDSEGNDILTCTSIKSFSSFVFSSEDLEKGESYNLYIGGSSTGSQVDGLYSNGTYTKGTLYTSFSISSTVTTKSL